MRRARIAAAGTVLCGLLTAPAADAIVGGGAPSRAYPAMAALEGNGDFRCGATLVRPTWVLTAAHCVQGDGEDVISPADLTVVLGRVRRSDESVGERIRATRVIRHESYATPASASNDIALVQLEKAAAPAPIRLAKADETALWSAGTTATVIGWGGQSALGIDGGSDDLREVQVPIQPDSTCDQTYRNTLGYDPASMLCAGNGLGGKDSCQGDSGGPMMVIDGGQPVQVGVVSFGLGCGFPTQYGVYARIGAPALADWIVRNAGPIASAPTPNPEPPVQQTPGAGTPSTPAKPLGLKRASRKGRELRLQFAVRRPVTRLTVSVSRVRGDSFHIIARTTRRRASRSFTAVLRLPTTKRSGRLRVRVVARDAGNRRVGFTRVLNTRG